MGWLKRLLGREDSDDRKWREWAKLPRAEYLRTINIDSRDHLNALIPTQIEEGRVQLVIQNLIYPAGLFGTYYELAILAWARGDRTEAEENFDLALQTARRAEDVARTHGLEVDIELPQTRTAIAAYLLDQAVPSLEMSNIGPIYLPQMGLFLLHSALEAEHFDQTRWEQLKQAWLEGRGAKYMLKDFQFYADVLTGQFQTGDDILKRHAKQWTEKSKRNPDLSYLSGYGEDNIYVVDELLAVILKRIGWEGSYKHAWPVEEDVQAQRTDREPDAFLAVKKGPKPQQEPSHDTLEEVITAFRVRAKADPDEYGEINLDRPPADQAKVRRALKALSLSSPSFQTLSEAYNLSDFVSLHTHFSLADPIDKRAGTLKGVTELYAGDFDLSPNFVMLVSSFERADYMAPEGGFPVIDRHSGEVFMADRDEWHDPDVVRESAIDGVTRWANYSDFLIWWLRP